jgi:hypothetical protein
VVGLMFMFRGMNRRAACIRQRSYGRAGMPIPLERELSDIVVGAAPCGRPIQTHHHASPGGHGGPPLHNFRFNDLDFLLRQTVQLVRPNYEKCGPLRAGDYPALLICLLKEKETEGVRCAPRRQC